MKTKLVILDRDGVINLDSDDYIKSTDEWIAYESSLTAIKRLNLAGIPVGVATNQSGVSRGYFSVEVLSEMHNKMNNELSKIGAWVDRIEYCPDHPDKPTNRRKPGTGMVLDLLEYFNVDASQCWFVGDSKSDIQCAINSGCNPALVLTGKGQKTLISLNNEKVPTFRDLSDFVDFLLR